MIIIKFSCGKNPHLRLIQDAAFQYVFGIVVLYEAENRIIIICGEVCSMIHQLKTTTKYFEAVAKGTKTFEVRKNDRNFKVGDFLALNEFDGVNETGKCMLVEVTYILDNEAYCKADLIIMGISPCAIRHKNGHLDDAFIFGEVPIYGIKK